MKLIVWANDRRIALAAYRRTRRAFRRHRLTPDAQQRLHAAKRRTP